MHRLQLAYNPHNLRFSHWHNGSYNPEPIYQCNGVLFVSLFKTREHALYAAISKISILTNCNTDIEMATALLKPDKELNYSDTYKVTGIEINITITTHPELC